MTFTQDDRDAPIGASVEFSLPDDSTAAGRARGAVRDTLTRWRLPVLVDACVLVVSELVTNAFRHGRPPFGVLLRRRAHDVRLEVSDGDPLLGAPTDRDDADGMAESGWGLDIVGAVSDDTGWEHIPGDGKSVFASWHVKP